MAITIQVDGPALIRYAAPTGGTLVDLGYSENGVEITENARTLDVWGDEGGGDAGVPIDVQYMGEFHTIRCLMTSWDETNLDVLRGRIASNNAAPGSQATIGTLMFASTEAYRLVIVPTSRPRNYLNVVLREAMEINKGTKHSKALVVGTAYANSSGVIYNTTTT